MLLPLLRSSVNLTQIHQIHAQIIIHGFPHHNHLLTKLVDLRSIDHARAVFDQIPSPTDYSWNSLIRGYTLNGSPQDSLFLYSKMLRTDVKPSNFTYPSVFKACSILDAIKQGEQIHTHVVKFGFLSDLFVNNSLIDMYCKCSCIWSAHRVLDEMQDRDEVSWNSIISGYVQWGEIENARELFKAMPIRRNVVCWTALINGYGREGNLVEMLGLFLQMLVSADVVEPNAATMVCLLSACSSLSDLKMGRWVSVFIDINAIPLNAILNTALIDMYSKCGDVEKARRLFDEISCKNLVSWNAMITGYVQRGMLEEAIQLFYLMQAKSVRPNEITMVNVLSACAGLGALKLGREVHLYLGRNGLDLNVILGTSLVDMYSKCGSLDDACLVFVKMANKDVAFCNAMILGLAHHGNGRDSLAILTQMEKNGTDPNDITFIGVLSACNHSRLVEEGRVQFSNMVMKWGLSPKVEHYACMVDLLGRAGHLEEAGKIVEQMRIEPGPHVWGSLLGACRIHCNIELAERASVRLFELEPMNAGNYVLLADIYAEAKMWEEVSRVKNLLEVRGLQKVPGCSWIEVNRKIYSFVSVDELNPRIEQLHALLVRLSSEMKGIGYVPDTKVVLYDLDQVEKEQIVLSHSEKLAVAFGLINSSNGETIRITKNLRLCEDCHSITKFISKFANREILVRDVNRFHHFRDGVCSCGDYW